MTMAGGSTSGRRAGRRVLLGVLIAVALLPGISPTAALAGDANEIVVRGAGWGHGIGMSQYGARGQAREGRSANKIIEYYYTGATVKTLSEVLPTDHFLITDTSPVWVNLERSTTTFRFEAVGGNVAVCHQVNGGCSWTAKPGEIWRFVTVGDGTCRLKRDGVPVGPPGPCSGTVRGMTPGGAHVRLADQPTTRDEYARGRIQLRTPDDGETIHASLEISLEQYLFGLAEMPASWKIEALRAQAIAARSYAAYRTQIHGPEHAMSESRRLQCWCHLFATVADQVFIGWDNESKTGGDRWVDAVRDTKANVATHPASALNNVVSAFYSSSTGGATQNNEDVWGGSPVPYLRSVPDPWSVDPGVGNPFATWTFRFTEAGLSTRFGLDAVDGIDIVKRFDSGAPSVVHIYGRLGGKRTKLVRTGAETRTALGLTGRHIQTITHGSTDFVPGDFDGDGKGDISVLLGATGAWWTMLGDGNGKPKPWANGSNLVESPVSGDFDGDGKDDVAVRKSSTGGWIVGLGGAGRFVKGAWRSSAPNPGTWRAGVVGDFDGDGMDDIAEYQPSTGTWVVLRSDGERFIRRTFYDFATQNPQWGEFVVGDFDGNGLDDILHRDTVTENLHVLFSTGTAFIPRLWTTLPADASWDVRAGDFNGNGRTDAAAFNPKTGAWWVALARNNRTAKTPQKWWDFGGTDWRAHVVADFNGDGRDDIANLNGAAQWKVLTSRGSGFRWGLWGSTPKGGNVTDALATDVDGDSKADIVSYNSKTKVLHVHRSTGASFDVERWGTLLK